MENQAIFDEITKLVNSQRQKLTDNAVLVSQLQGKCDKLTESLKQSEARQVQTIATTEYEKQIEELQKALTRAKDEIKLIENVMTCDDVNTELNYFVSENNSETGNSTKYSAYSLEFPENGELNERKVTKLKKQLSRFEEELARISGRHQAEQVMVSHEKQALKMRLHQAAEKQKQTDAAHSLEVAGLQNQIRQAEDERNKALEELEMMRSSPAEYARYNEETQHKELVAAKEQIQEMLEKYEQLSIYADNLREEKSLLQTKRDEALSQHSETLKKYQDLKIEMNELNEEREKENFYFDEKLLTMTETIDAVKEELKDARLEAARLDDLFSEPDDQQFTELAKKVDGLQSQLIASTQEISTRDKETEDLRLDLQLALKAKETVSADQLDLSIKLQEVVDMMATQAGQFKTEIAVLNSSTNGLELQLKSLQAEKDKLQAEAELKNCKDLQDQLGEERKMCATLRTQLARLEDELRNKEAEFKRKILPISQEVESCVQTIQSLSKECHELSGELQTRTISFNKERDLLVSSLSTVTNEKKLLEQRNKALDQLRRKKCQNLRANLRNKTKRFLKEKQALLSASSNLTNKNEFLQKIHRALKVDIIHKAELLAKLRADSEALREACTTQKAAAEASNLKCGHLMEQKDQLNKKIEKLRTNLKAKVASNLAEKDGFNATIACLLATKRTLEENQCTLYESIGKLETEISALKAINTNRSNSTVASNGPAAPTVHIEPLAPHNTVAKLSVGAGFMKKSSIIYSAARREKRKSAHDKHRMQAYWNDTRDFGTMTDPEDNRATAGNMELMENPPKAENAELKTQMIKDEQPKSTMEQRRLRRQRRRSMISPLGSRIQNPKIN